MIMEKHRRSRKLAFLMLALIFLNSVLTLKLRSYQRRQNLDLLRSRLRNESNREIFDSIEKKSKTEDMLLLIGTNIVALIIIAGFDRQRIIDENKDKERAVKVFGDSQKWLSFFCGMKKLRYFYLQKQQISCKILRYKKTGG